MNGKREYDLRDQERREQAANVRVGALCRVEKFDPAAMRYRTQPQILSVPVALVRGGGFVLRPCYKAGDVGVLLYIDHDIDRIAASGEESEPNTERNHSDEDAVFIGAFVPASNPLSGLPDNCLVMATEGGGIYVAVKQDKVEIKGDVEVQGKVKVRDDVIAKTISLVNHKHTDSRNGNTSAPLP